MNEYDVAYLKSNNIDVDLSIELLGDIDTYNDILKEFIEESKEKIERLKNNIESNNLVEYSIDAHSLKSDSKYLGFKELANISYEHEIKSKENDLKYINENFNQLLDEYERIINIVNNYLEGLNENNNSCR